MAFVNEYISEEDIKKHEIDKGFLERHPEYNTLPSDFKPSWTIDRDRLLYFQQTGGANPAFSDEYWIQYQLNLGDKEFVFRLERGKGSLTLNENPYLIIWKSAKLISPSAIDKGRFDEVLSLLKEALTAYGYAGVRKQLPNTLVKFEF